MIGGRASFILLSTLAVIQTLDVPPQISLTEVALGENVTLTCTVSKDSAGLFYWFKMKFGHMFETVAQGTFGTASLKGQFSNSRFNVTNVDDVYFLTIRNVSKEDEAMYYCQAGAAYVMSFFNGTHLAVNDDKNKQKTVHVKPIPAVYSVAPGHNMTLQCSFQNKESAHQCPDEDRVFWYRAGSESVPGIMYTDNSSCDKQEGRRCVSSLSKTIQDPSDAGNYYCAVVACGEILFGEGTNVCTKAEIRQEGLLVIVLGSLLACSVLVNVALIITRRNQKSACDLCKGQIATFSRAEQNGPAADQPSNTDGEEAGINYVALDFPSRKAKRLANKRDLPEDCTYSYMRNDR